MTHIDYIDAMAEVLEICSLDPEPDTQQGIRLLELTDAIEAYEREHFPEMFPSRCPWCGREGLGFDESEKPADYCHHD